LAALTRAVYGYDMPKQFAALGTGRSFLQETMDRIASLVPPARTFVVVSRAHAKLAAEQLAGFAGVHVVLQPTNLGTTAGVLLPLVHVLHRDPDALVAVFPCDHRFLREEVFRESVQRALFSAGTARGGLVLVGATPESAAPDLGWIVPGRPTASDRLGPRIVRRFVEKPPEQECRELLRQGGLWNTFVIAARGRSLWRAARRYAPQVALPLARYSRSLGTGASERCLDEAYEAIPVSDLSRDVLERARDLRVVPLVDSGWCDCGTPERLFQTVSPREAERLRRAYESWGENRSGRGGEGAPTASAGHHS
jgi:mannose-1-phosphate guanylyltransferase